MGRKGIQVDEEVFNAVKLMYPDMSWTNILKLLLEPKGLPKDCLKKYVEIVGPYCSFSYIKV